MKAMKNKITMMFATMLFVLVLAPSIQAKAYGVDQTAATATTVTIAWDAYSSAEAWYIALDREILATLPANTTSYTIQNLKQGTPHVVEVVYGYKNYSGEMVYYSEGTKVIKTTPNKMKKAYVEWSNSDSIDMKIMDPSVFLLDNEPTNYADGYKIEIKDVKGKKKKTFDTLNYVHYLDGACYGWEIFKAPSALKNKGMQYKVTPYITLDNGNKVYGDAVTKVAIPQAKITKAKYASKSKIKITWKKISGASSYTIYRTTNGGKSFKKVKKVSKKTTSYTIKKSYVKHTKNGKYGILISADKVKVGKNRYNSTKSYITSYY